MDGARDARPPPHYAAILTTNTRGPLVLYNAGALARPMRAALDSFAAREGVRVEQETAASLELARKVIDLGGEPDVVALADVAVFSELLMPNTTRWYVVLGASVHPAVEGRGRNQRV